MDTTFVPISERPNPAPDLGAVTVGLPITVGLDSISTLGTELRSINVSEITISAFALTLQGSSTPVPARIITAAGVAGTGAVLTNDPAAQMKPSQICLLPLAPLSVNATYNAVFTATVKGKPVHLTWSFTTGTNK